ncbi:S1C family serine protease [uncultured Oscillibacter sp.]|uniref:S1C family serine protease n=1 Tax=uncultured Oscillibacter sp. TaxID=876091 RepID=UPI001F8DEB54|nr:trypsin-like peptidase domain-containing protein [uncultured Oscillibacter sp.]HJB76490.1 trypsin-like peptidase domain-containing protein [Candidatus Oscillibacter avistercoris]
MEEKEQLMSQRPEEVVETYRQPVPGEVVERYSRPLPGRMTPPPLAERRKKRRTGLWIFLICLTVAVGIGAGLWIWDIFFADDPKDPFEYDYDFGWEEDASASQEITIPTYPTGEGVVLEVETDHGPELTAQEIYQRVNPSVVTVLAQLDGSVSVGTGVIFRSDGYILTNHHVLAGGRDCSITLDTGQSYEARYVAGDERNDLAVLKVELTGLPAATFGDSDQLAVGDRVYAIGNPLGVELRGTLTDGIVSAINRDVWVDGRTMTLIQTNAALNSGNSGGPLINAYGQVVGINTIKMSSSYSNIEGLGFAIPSASIRRLVNDLLTYGEVQPEPTFGVTVNQLGTWLEEDLRGIQVIDVTAGSAADLAGIRTGDFILSAAGTPVNSSQDLLRVRRGLYVGDQVTMEIWRDGQRLEVTLELNNAAS